METTEIKSYLFKGVVDNQPYAFELKGMDSQSSARLKLIENLEKVIEQLKADEVKDNQN